MIMYTWRAKKNERLARASISGWIPPQTVWKILNEIYLKSKER